MFYFLPDDIVLVVDEVLLSAQHLKAIPALSSSDTHIDLVVLGFASTHPLH